MRSTKCPSSLESAMHCTRQNVQYEIMVIIMVLVLRRGQKNIFTFPHPVTLFFDLVTSKLLYQLLLTWVTSPESLNIVRRSVFELTVGRAHTDGQTDARRTDKPAYGRGVTRNAASYERAA